MKKESGSKILLFTLCSVLLISLVAGVVSAEETAASKIFGNGGASFSKFFESSKDILARILLTALVVVLVYSVSSSLPFVSTASSKIKWALSIIIGLLSFLFVSVDNIRYILANYEALGIALTSIIPLIIIMIFTVQLREQNEEVAYIINKVVIVLFIGFVLTRWYYLTFYQTLSSSQAPELAVLYPVTAGVAFIWLFIEEMITRRFTKAKIKALHNRASRRVAKAIGGAKTLEAVEEGMGSKGKDGEWGDYSPI